MVSIRAISPIIFLVFITKLFMLESTHLLHNAKCECLSPGHIHIRWHCDRVKCMTIIDAQHSEDWQENPGTDPNCPPHLERIKVPETVPGITTFRKSQSKNRRLIIQNDRVTKFNLVFGVDGATRILSDRYIRRTFRDDHPALVATHRNNLRTLQKIEAHHSVSTQFESLES